MFRFLHQLQDC